MLSPHHERSVRERLLDLSEPGLNIRDDGGVLTLEREVSPDVHQVVTWRISDDELTSLAAGLRRDAREAMGPGRDGVDLLLVHLAEALNTFDGYSGDIDVVPWGLRVRTL